MRFTTLYVRAADRARRDLGVEATERGSFTWEGRDFREARRHASPAEAVSAFIAAGASLIAEGFAEIAADDPDSRRPKPAWQRDVDAAVLAEVTGHPGRDALRAEASMAARPGEPLMVWLYARAAVDPPGPLALARLEAAEELMADRGFRGEPTYCSALTPDELRRGIAVLRCRGLVARHDRPGALELARLAYAFEPDRELVELKLSLQIELVPEEREAAFAELYPWSRDPFFARLAATPGFAEYVARREAEPPPPYAWSPVVVRSPLRDVAAAERALGVALPADYCAFLVETGLVHMDVTKGDMTSGVDFIRARHLVRERDNFRRSRTTSLGVYDEDGREIGEVAEADLIPIAHCSIQSNSILLQPGGDEGEDSYFAWFHDGEDELYPMGSSFAEIIYELQNAPLPGGSRARGFLELPPDEDEDG